MDRVRAVSELQFGEDAPLLHVMSTMRSMRRLKPDPVPREMIEKLITAASYAPSGGNNQTFSFVVVTDREQLARLAPIWRRIVRWYTATQTAPAHMDQGAWQRTLGALEHQAEHFEDIPALIVACYELRSAAARMMRTLDKQRAGLGILGARHLLTAARNTPRMMTTAETASIYPAVQNLLLMARALGLAATLTTWHVMFEQEVKSVLGIPRSVNTYAIIPVGWPAGRFGPVSRRSAADSIHWQKW
jgi:nitroreductase